MKKQIIITAVMLFALAINVNAQIPNKGFESWTTYGNCMEPDGWNTTNQVDTTASHFAITRSTDHYPANVGSYSIRLQNDTTMLDSIFPINYLGWGFTWNNPIDAIVPSPAFPISGHPTSITGYYKSFPENGDTLTIQTILFHEGSMVAVAQLFSTTEVSNWTSFSVAFGMYADADSALISLACQYEGVSTPRGNSILYVDNLNFDTLITSSPEMEAKKALFNLYPNPSSDAITINFTNPTEEKTTINIFNTLGELVKTDVCKQGHCKVDIKNLPVGTYTVVANTKLKTEQQQLIIQR